MFKYIIESDKIIFSFPNRMDTPKCQEIEKELFEKIEANSNLSIVFDLKDVVYVASSFLRIVVQTAKKSTSSKFSFANISPEIKKVFKIAGFDKSINLD